MTPHEPVFVVGAGRTGTSMVAGMLYHLGIFMGEYLIAPDEGNPRGYFEDLHLAQIDSNLLHEVYTEEEWHDKTKEVYAKRVEQGVPWGFKSPQICNTIPLLLQLTEEMELQPRFIYCMRDFNDTLKSSTKKWQFKKRRTHKLEIQEKLDYLEDHLQNQKVLRLWYEDIKERPYEAIEKIATFLHIQPTDRQKAKARAHILSKKNPTKIQAIHHSLV